MEVIEQTNNENTLDAYIESIQSDLNDIIMDPTVSGYETMPEQDISYGVTFTAGINPATDTVLDVGCGMGEFYHYIERFSGQRLYKYYGMDTNEELLEINKFRSNQDTTVNLISFNTDDFMEAHSIYSPDVLKNLSILGFTDVIDWVVLCNYINDSYSVDSIIQTIEFWSKVPEKGAVFTFKLTEEYKLADVASKLILSETLNEKVIIRSDFLKNWISVYIYNSRD